MKTAKTKKTKCKKDDDAYTVFYRVELTKQEMLIADLAIKALLDAWLENCGNHKDYETKQLTALAWKFNLESRPDWTAKLQAQGGQK